MRSITRSVSTGWRARGARGSRGKQYKRARFRVPRFSGGTMKFTCGIVADRTNRGGAWHRLSRDIRKPLPDMFHQSYRYRTIGFRACCGAR